MEQLGRAIKRAHKRLFALGLNEDHFDVMMMHLRDALQARGFLETRHCITLPAAQATTPLHHHTCLSLPVFEVAGKVI